MSKPTRTKRTTASVFLPIKINSSDRQAVKDDVIELMEELLSVQRKATKIQRALEKEVEEARVRLDSRLGVLRSGFENRKVRADVLIDYRRGQVEFYFEGICRRAVSLREYEEENAK